MIKARLKYLIKTQKGKVPKKISDDNTMPPYLSMDYLRGECDNILYVKPKEEYKLIEEDEVLVLYDGANAGEVMLSKSGFLSSTMAVVTPKDEFFEKRFLFYFLKSIEGELKKASTGTTIPHLDQNFLFNSLFEFPEVEYQKPISDFLDIQSAKITHFIQTKQRFIELLKEQRQSIIDETLDIDAKKVRLKFCVSKVGSGVTPKGGASVYQTSGIIFLRSQNIHDDGLRLDDVAYITEKIHSEMSNSQVKRGDVLLNITGASIGRCYWFNSDDEANVNQHVSIIRPVFEILDSEFLMYQIQSQRIQHLINTVQGASREGLTIHEIKNYPLLTPPTIEEQKRIVEHIQTETKTLDIAIGKAEREIELIKEYREAMIAEAVTGRIVLSSISKPTT